MKQNAQQSMQQEQLQKALQHHQAGRLQEAEALYKKIPNHPDALHLWGVIAYQQGQNAIAVERINKAIRLFPQNAAYYSNIGLAYQGLNKLVEAEASYRKALKLRPNYAEAHNNLGNVLKDQGKLNEAVACYRKALELSPDYVDAHSNLGVVLKDQGKLAEAVSSFQRALALKPNFVDAYSNLLFAGLYANTFTPAELFSAHRAFSDRYETPLKQYWTTHQNSKESDKRLKIGYVSADFRLHAVAYFIEPVLANHDKSQFEVFCYYNHVQQDSVTDRLMTYADHWVPCKGMSDDQLAQRIREDSIDILIDLSGHSSGNRLLTFARKPAPVQVTYLGYPGTTGLSTMDYRLTDQYFDPPGMTEQFNTEQLWRLPNVATCYRANIAGPKEIDHPPMEDNGYVTFGCFNNFAKVTDHVIEVWSRILVQIPDARLMLEIAGIDDAQFRAEVEARLVKCGMHLERLILLPRKKENQYVLYNRIDIALDPFPYNGGTTSYDTLWMGVPLVTLAGAHCVSRLGVSVLQNAGLPELIAQTEDDYIAIAAGLALNADKLKMMRHRLRKRIEGSPLMDASRFTKNIESAYRGMWHRWCTTNHDHM
jgi:protein O-GlcNAc transferase